MLSEQELIARICLLVSQARANNEDYDRPNEDLLAADTLCRILLPEGYPPEPKKKGDDTK